MKMFRVFTNDRRKVRFKGTPLYSCLSQMAAESIEIARAYAKQQYTQPGLAPVKVVNWPPTDAEEKWLEKHVGSSKGRTDQDRVILKEDKGICLGGSRHPESEE